MDPTEITYNEDQQIVIERVRLFSVYKDFLDQQQYAEQFDSRSNLHSSVLEEFLYYLFRDLVTDFGQNALIGKSHTFKDIFFVPPSYQEMVNRAYAQIERKDHDFVIGVTVSANFNLHTDSNSSQQTDGRQTETHLFDIAAVAIECKTYLDKTMLEGSSRAAEQLKARNPNAMYIVLMEWLKLTSAVNLRKYEVDQIYVLRKQRNTDREFRFAEDYDKNPINADVVWHLYETVRNHLTTDWEVGIEQGLQRGWLL
ncbi:MAG: Bpu10I family restriction endonuclease [Chloroflexota bacterium]